MYLIKDMWSRAFGDNSGMELIAERLRNGVENILVWYDKDDALIEFRGTGKYVKGHGVNKEYDISFRLLRVRRDKMASSWTELKHNPILIAKLEDYRSGKGGLDYVACPNANDHKPSDVIECLKRTASRLKPHQSYAFDRFKITNSIYHGDCFVIYTDDLNPIFIPQSMLASGRIFTVDDLGRHFDPDRVGVFDEVKIARQHRKDTDLKRWVIFKEQPEADSKTAFIFTPRKTAKGPVCYYSMAIDIDVRQSGKPFYLTALMDEVYRQLSDLYPVQGYHLNIFPDNVEIKAWEMPLMTVVQYLERQDRHPESRVQNPILINDKPKVDETWFYNYTVNIVRGEWKLLNEWKN